MVIFCCLKYIDDQLSIMLDYCARKSNVKVVIFNMSLHIQDLYLYYHSFINLCITDYLFYYKHIFKKITNLYDFKNI